MSTTPKREYVELRSDEVQEILGAPPAWLVQWGTLIVFVGVVTLIAVAAVVEYSDVVPTQITITRTSPPLDVRAPREGYIAAFLAQDSQLVQEGQVLAILRSSANYSDVRQLDALLAHWLHWVPDSIERIQPPHNLQLGEMQTEYAAFVQAIENYRFGKGDKGTQVRQNTTAFNQQISKMEQSIAVDLRSIQRLDEQLTVARERLQRLTTLYELGAISRMEFEREKERIAELERQKDALEENVLRKQNEITALRRNRQDASFAEAETTLSAVGQIRQTLGNLQAALNRWKSNYLILAPISGRVALNGNIFLRHQYVRAGQQLLVILPKQDDGVVAHLKLPVVNSGKVRPGLPVIIKLESYPYAEFGVLEGVVHSKSVVPTDGFYTVAVSLPRGLTTSYGKTIPLEHQLNGIAEVITEQKSLLRRIYEQIFIAFR
ncbi:MAG: HlyD family secretion protein [Saprospiraceae bacterium]|nr:HlyD family secretion protein [Saprospiraceae bacterium]MDW8484769.1 HlyD family efflux transporter periplasmic adaptor subunit [Saprospiraceae bacterium]